MIRGKERGWRWRMSKPRASGDDPATLNVTDEDGV